MTTIHLKASVQWLARQSPTSERWIAVSDAMNLTTEADSLDELHSVINETMQLVLNDLLVENELQQYLRERGWEATDIDSATEGTDVRFFVPWQLVAEGARDQERRAN
jgi:hypothetical protein